MYIKHHLLLSNCLFNNNYNNLSYFVEYEILLGKTSLVMRYAHDVFDTDYKATIGVDFEVEKFEILGVPFTLQMWDTAGSERFQEIFTNFEILLRIFFYFEFEKFIQCIASSYYRGANAVMICYDYSKIQTLNTTRKWLDNAIAENPTQEVFDILTYNNLIFLKFILFLVGTKRELVSEAIARQIDDDAMKIAKDINAEFWSVSGYLIFQI